MKLIKPSTGYKDSYLSMVKEFKKQDKVIHPSTLSWETQNWHGFIGRHRDAEIGYNSSTLHVPAINYWMVDYDQEVVGAVSLRLRLNQRLLRGGHIGYGIRPSRRGQGLGKEMLRLTLHEALRHGIQDVLICCDPGNIASRAVILSNGGVFDSLVDLEDEEGAVVAELERYWIFL